MTDETAPQPEKPIEVEVVPEQPKHLSVQKGKLELLPTEIKEEMDTRILSGEAVSFIREDMIKKYPGVEELKIGHLAWYKRAKRLKGGTQKELQDGTVVKKDMVAALPTAEDLQKAVSTVINPEISLERKSEALSSLFNKATQRLAILEQRQKQFLNPELEALMVTYLKEQRALLETVTKLQEVLQRDVLQQMRGELDEYTRVILTTVYQSHNLTYTGEESKFDLFRITLEQHLVQTLKAYNSQPKP